MPRPKPLFLSRPDDLFEVRTFSDPLQPDVPPFEIGLRALPEYSATAQKREIEREIREIYLTGDAEYQRTDGASGTPPVPVPLQGRTVVMTVDFASDIALLVQMERAGWEQMQEAGHATSTEEPYTVEEWIALSANMPGAFGEIFLFALDLSDKAMHAGKNSSRTSTGNSSEFAPTEEPPTTL